MWQNVKRPRSVNILTRHCMSVILVRFFFLINLKILYLIRNIFLLLSFMLSLGSGLNQSWCVTGVRSLDHPGLPPVAAPSTCSSASFALWRCRTRPCTSRRPSAPGPPRCWISPQSRAASPFTRCNCASTPAACELSWQRPRARLRVRARHPQRAAADQRRLKPTFRCALPLHPLCLTICCL